MKYTASAQIPGYPPQFVPDLGADPGPTQFDTTAEAWLALYDVRRMMAQVHWRGDGDAPDNPTTLLLKALANETDHRSHPTIAVVGLVQAPATDGTRYIYAVAGVLES